MIMPPSSAEFHQPPPSLFSLSLSRGKENILGDCIHFKYERCKKMAGIVDIITEVPPMEIDMQDLPKVLAFWLNDEERDFIQRVIPRTGIKKKRWYFPLSEVAKWGQTERQERFRELVTSLGSSISIRLLSRNLLLPREVDMITFTSVTGWATPDITIRVGKRIGLRNDVIRHQILGMGCYAATNTLAMIADRIDSGRVRNAIMLDAEFYSITFQPSNKNKDNLLGPVLFGDSMAGVLLGKDGLLRIIDYEPYTDFRSIDQMGFELEDDGFRLVLGKKVPDIIGRKVIIPVKNILKRNGLKKKNIKHWAIHPGGMRILENVCKTLKIDLPPHTMKINEKYGNLASVAVLFVLRDIIDSGDFDRGDRVMALTFGPGLTIEAMLLEFTMSAERYRELIRTGEWMRMLQAYLLQEVMYS